MFFRVVQMYLVGLRSISILKRFEMSKSEDTGSGSRQAILAILYPKS